MEIWIISNFQCCQNSSNILSWQYIWVAISYKVPSIQKKHIHNRNIFGFLSLFSNEISNWSPQWKYFFICCINLAFLHYVLSNVIKCLLKLPSTIKAYPQSKHFLDYLHWMFSNEISNWSPLWKYICIFCIYLAFSTLYYQMSPQIVF